MTGGLALELGAYAFVTEEVVPTVGWTKPIFGIIH